MCEDWCDASRNYSKGSKIPKVDVCSATHVFSLMVDGRYLSCKKSIKPDLISIIRETRISLKVRRYIRNTYSKLLPGC